MFFKKKSEVKEVIEFNKQKLFDAIGILSDRLHIYKEDPGVRDVIEIVNLWKNNAILDVSYARDEKERIAYQAKLTTLDELKHALERDLNRTIKEVKDETNRPTGTLKMFRRVNNQAGSSI